jgi:hypothetical protein
MIISYDTIIYYTQIALRTISRIKFQTLTVIEEPKSLQHSVFIHVVWPFVAKIAIRL